MWLLHISSAAVRDSRMLC